jgi:hypothetical protein
MILDRSTWSPAGEAKTKSPRNLVRTATTVKAPASADPSSGSWLSSADRRLPESPSSRIFRIAERQDRQNILWRHPFPGSHTQPCHLGKPHLRHDRGQQ